MLDFHMCGEGAVRVARLFADGACGRMYHFHMNLVIGIGRKADLLLHHSMLKRRAGGAKVFHPGMLSILVGFELTSCGEGLAAFFSFVRGWHVCHHLRASIRLLVQMLLLDVPLQSLHLPEDLSASRFAACQFFCLLVNSRMSSEPSGCGESLAALEFFAIFVCADYVLTNMGCLVAMFVLNVCLQMLGFKEAFRAACFVTDKRSVVGVCANMGFEANGTVESLVAVIVFAEILLRAPRSGVSGERRCCERHIVRGLNRWR